MTKSGRRICCVFRKLKPVRRDPYGSIILFSIVPVVPEFLHADTILVRVRGNADTKQALE